MTGLALALVLAAAFLHAGWNLALHDTGDRVPAMAVSGLAAGALLLPAVVLAPPWGVLPLVILSALAETAYALCLSAGYSRGELGLVYPLARGTAPLLVTLGGWLVLAERPSPIVALGALALASGLAAIATAGRQAGRADAVALAFLTGAAIASYSLVDARAVREVGPVSYLGAVLGLQGLLLAALVRFRPARLGPALRPGVLIAIGSVAAYLLVLLAYQRAEAGRVATLRETSILIGLVLSRGKPGWRTWAGAGLVVIGAVLVAL